MRNKILAALACSILTITSCSDSGQGPGLSDLSLWAVDTLAKASQPEFAEIKLSPRFRSGKHEYEAEVEYGVTNLHILAWGGTPSTSISASRITPDGTEEQITQTFVADTLSMNFSSSDDGVKTTQTAIVVDGADLSVVLEKDADFVRVFRQIGVGTNTLKIRTLLDTGEEGRTYTIDLVRRRPDLNDPLAAQLHFIESLKSEGWDEVIAAIESGADVNVPLEEGSKSMTPLAFAAAAGQREAVSRMIEAGADVNLGVISGDSDLPTGMSPLMLAAAAAQADLIPMLIGAGADSNYEIPGDQTSFGQKAEGAGLTALTVAVNTDQAETVRQLIQAGADANHAMPNQEGPMADSSSGATLLMLAVNKNNAEIAQLLIDGGANLNYVIPGERQTFGQNPGTAGLTALTLAVKGNSAEMARLLISAGADINHKMPDQEGAMGDGTGGVSLLMFAVDDGHGEMVRMLLDADADVNYEIPGERPFGRNSRTAGVTALRIAKAGDNKEITDMLLEAGARE